MPSEPGLWNVAAQGAGLNDRNCTSSASPASAPFTPMGPMIECGPLPGLAARSRASSSIGTPGWSLFRKWDQVPGYAIVSPGSISPG